MPITKEKIKIGMKALSAKLVSYSTFIIGITILVALVMWGSDKLTLNARNCTTMNTYYQNAGTTLGHLKFKQEDDKYRQLRDFNIKTAYNCCCAGNFKNDFVNLCALQNCIKQGVRCLDFEIYSVNDEPVIATSSVDDDTIKEMYNSVSFVDAMNTISNMAFSSGGAPNYRDPLILNFRIMSTNKKIYGKMANHIEHLLGSHLLPSCNSYNNYNNNTGELFIGSLVGDSNGKKPKVLIFVDLDHQNEEELILPKTKFLELVNLVGNIPSIPSSFDTSRKHGLKQNTFYSVTRYQNILHPPSADDLKNNNKMNITMCIPDLSDKAANNSFAIPASRGCQMIGMCFQTQDSNLQYCNSFFNQYAFVLKDDDLRSHNICNKAVEPLPEKQTFKSRKVEIPGQPGISFTV